MLYLPNKALFLGHIQFLIFKRVAQAFLKLIFCQGVRLKSIQEHNYFASISTFEIMWLDMNIIIILTHISYFLWEAIFPLGS